MKRLSRNKLLFCQRCKVNLFFILICRCLHWIITPCPRPATTSRTASSPPLRPHTTTTWPTAWWRHRTDKATPPSRRPAAWDRPEPAARRPLQTSTSTTAAAHRRPLLRRPDRWFLPTWRRPSFKRSQLLTIGQLLCRAPPDITTIRCQLPQLLSEVTDSPECTAGTNPPPP